MQRRQRVAVLAMQRSTLFETGIALEALGFDWGGEGPLYDVSVYGPPTGVRLDGGVTLTPERSLAAALEADTVVVPGTSLLEGPFDEEMLQVLVAAHECGQRVVSICTGAFVLGAAGLLAGRSATTHWRQCARLRQMFPDVLVLDDRLYVDDGVITGAGSAAGIDLCLHLIREDHGAAVANRVARQLVVSAHRDGGQAQFARCEPMEPEAHWLSELGAWVDDHLEHPLSVKELCAVAGVSRRTLARRFEDGSGTTPSQWLTRRRIEHARTLLESTSLSMELIAARCGFGSTPTFRAAFRRTVGVSPRSYRGRFHDEALDLAIADSAE